MNKKDVPQDRGILEHWHTICYVTDEKGDIVRSQSAGWEPINIANGIVWEQIHEERSRILDRVRRGELSPLAYYMNTRLMDVKLLARYAGVAAWRVKRHLQPRIFLRLDDAMLKRYASVLNLTLEEMKEVP
jgi:hypothetical protein